MHANKHTYILTLDCNKTMICFFAFTQSLCSQSQIILTCVFSSVVPGYVKSFYDGKYYVLCIMSHYQEAINILTGSTLEQGIYGYLYNNVLYHDIS